MEVSSCCCCPSSPAAATNGGGIGTTVAAALTPFALLNKTVPLHIGRYSFASPVELPFSGYIDQVRFSAKARYTAAFVPLTKFVNDMETLALYSFDELVGQTGADTSTHANVSGLQQNAMFAMPPICN